MTPSITTTSTITIMRTKLTLLSSPPAKTENIAQGNRQGLIQSWGQGVQTPTPQENHWMLYVSLEILVQTTWSRSNLITWSNCFLKEVHMALCEIC